MAWATPPALAETAGRQHCARGCVTQQPSRPGRSRCGATWRTPAPERRLPPVSAWSSGRGRLGAGEATPRALARAGRIDEGADLPQPERRHVDVDRLVT